jgi:hypothetical protein
VQCAAWRALRSRHFFQHEQKPTLVKVRRGFVLEDGLALVDRCSERLKHRISVVYIGIDGHQEAGIGW